MHSISPTLPHWTKEFFDDVYLDISEPFVASNTALLLLEEIKKQTSIPVKTFFDQCSGGGQLSLQLAQQGLTGVAVEQNVSYVQKSKEMLKKAGLENQVEFVCADAGSFVPFSKDLSISWHTSLGYNGKEGALLLLKNLVAATKKEGVVIVDMRDLVLYQKEETHNSRPIILDGKENILHRQGKWEGQVLLQNWVLTQDNKTVWEKPNTSCYHVSKGEIQLFAKEHSLKATFVPKPHQRLWVFLVRQ